jgi:hypothetical protein
VGALVAHVIEIGLRDVLQDDIKLWPQIFECFEVILARRIRECWPFRIAALDLAGAVLPLVGRTLARRTTALGT